MRAALAAVLAVVLSAALPAAQSNGSEKFTAFAVDLSNTRRGAAASVVDITVNRWSTDAERDRLLTVFREKGQDGLLSALQKLPVVGYINTPGSLRYDLHFARQRPEAEGGRMVFLMTDRYITAWEARNQPRSIDYPFTLIQLKVDKDGNGVGKASIATKITETKDGTIELENFSNVPVMLNEVKKVK
jgi:predicted dienelactone hydrolase